jgi:hypothetical protein
VTAEGTTSKGTGSISCDVEFCIFYRLSLRTLRTKDVVHNGDVSPKSYRFFIKSVSLSLSSGKKSIRPLECPTKYKQHCTVDLLTTYLGQQRKCNEFLNFCFNIFGISIPLCVL